MIYSERQVEFLRVMSGSWPPELSLSLVEEECDIEGHQLEGELVALARDRWASFPFYVADNIAWITVAPDVEQLQAGLAILRAWVIPSMAWEDATPFVSPDDATGALGECLLSISPAGYFRWRCAVDQGVPVAARLAEFRRLEVAAPSHVREQAPSLLELRQGFDLALITGDRVAAWTAIEDIDRHRLDSAVNTQFMRVRVFDQFREFERIVNYQQLDELLQVHVPPAARLAIARAFHALFLAPHEDLGDALSVQDSYRTSVESRISGLVALCSPEEGPEAARLLAYRAALRADVTELRRIAELSGDEIVEEILSGFPIEPDTQPSEPPVRAEAHATKPTVEPGNRGELLLEALTRRDYGYVQEIGIDLLAAEAEELAPLSPAVLSNILYDSLKVRPNPRLVAALDALNSEDRTDLIKAIPNSWPEFFETVASKDWRAAHAFLTTDPVVPLFEVGQMSADAMVNRVEECITDPAAAGDAEAQRVLQEALPVFVKEFIVDDKFPRGEWVDLYVRLFEMWAESKRGSAHRPACEILLTLAGGVLEHSVERESAITESVRRWWHTRAVHAMLPFLLSALVLLSEYASNTAACESLWIEGAELIRRDSVDLTRGERALWGRVGARLGINSTDVASYLAVDAAADAHVADPIREAGYRKIAIVSLRERAVRLAAEDIRARTDAKIVLVSEVHPGTAAASAASADVILFTSLCNSHATYRAFDRCRERVAYVPGTTADSIVVALERWSADRGPRSSAAA